MITLRDLSRRIMVLLCSFGATSLCAQQTLYVAPQGDDAIGKGTATQPYASLQKAYDVAVKLGGQDTLYIQLAAGRYELQRTIRMNQSPRRPLVIAGAENGKTVLSGGIRLRNWKVNDKGWWETHVDEVERYGLRIEQLYVNGQRGMRARTPDQGWMFVEDSKQWEGYHAPHSYALQAMQRFTLAPKDLEPLRHLHLEEGKEVVAMFFHKWDNTRNYLSKIVPDSGYVFTEGKGMRLWNPIRKGSRVVLENFPTALSAPGEWFVSRSGKLQYIPRAGETINNAEVYAPVVKTLLEIQGYRNHLVKNITFRNLHFEHAAYVMPKWGNYPEQAAVDIPSAIYLQYTNEITFDHCSLQHTGQYGIWFDRACTDCRLQQSLLRDLGAGGVKVGSHVVPKAGEETHHIHLENNIIQHAGNVLPCGAGILVLHSGHNQILHNEISDIKYTGISVGWVWGYGKSVATHNEIAYNHIHHIGWGELSDMGGIYTLGPSEGTHIHHNVIHDIFSYDYGGWGFYTDEGSSDILFENNLVYACKSGAFHQHYGRDNIIRNNIFGLGQFWQLQFSKVEQHRSFDFKYNIVLADCGQMLSGPWNRANVAMSHNLYWDLRTPNPTFAKVSFKEWSNARKETGSYVADPLFVDPLKGDFHFRSTKNIKKIGFQPFDYTQAGVYGADSWQREAQLSQEVINRFKAVVRSRKGEYSGYYAK